jgi:hypothetical protein
MYIILAVFIVYFDFSVPHENWTIVGIIFNNSAMI